MTDDNLIIDSSPESEAQKRIKQLSEKVRLTSEERDEKNRLLEEQSTKNAELTRERDFYQGFSDVVSTNPAAKDHKDDILAKVKGGYSVEDATYAVLGKAGKLGSQSTPETTPSPAGGSASTGVPQGGSNKALHEMTREERKALVLEAQNRGDIALT